ncbi:MAG: nuclear transport factor 2 family protein [Tepidiformaceae bacterium]
MTASASSNTARVTEILEAFGRGDIASILEQLADDVRFTSHLDPIVPWAGEFSGKANVASFFQALGSAIEVAEHPVNAVVAQGDIVVAMGDVRFSVRKTGKEGSSSWVYIWKLAEGEVQSYDQFNDPGLAEAFR